MKPKHQRLVLALVAFVALIGAGFIAAAALKAKRRPIFTPPTTHGQRARSRPGKAIRLGGMVQKGSIVRAADGVSITFIVQDRDATQKVAYRGITPDLFVEGSGVVADGRLRPDGVFVADRPSCQT